MHTYGIYAICVTMPIVIAFLFTASHYKRSDGGLNSLLFEDVPSFFPFTINICEFVSPFFSFYRRNLDFSPLSFSSNLHLKYVLLSFV